MRVRWLLAIAAILIGLAMTRAWLDVPPSGTTFGITYSTAYAFQLGLEVRDSFSAMLDDLGARDIRLPVYWWEVEGEHDRFDWSLYDWLMDEAGKRGAHVTLVVGAKAPRWPECYIPSWAWPMGDADREGELLDFINTAVTRYRSHPALAGWQIENEPFFPFGICPAPNVGLVERETDAVKTLDTHPVQLTVSGELEPFLRQLQSVDRVGFSLYRITWHPLYGYSIFPLTPEFYRIRGWLIGLSGRTPVISELQGEPWFPFTPSVATSPDWYDAFDAGMLLSQIDFARRTHLTPVYLWGAEWWYFLKLHGNDRLWEAAKSVF
jgi:hypothetical protein